MLTIVHRLHTIIDSDRILVVAAGQAGDSDEAHTLLQKYAAIFLVEWSNSALKKYNVHHKGQKIIITIRKTI